MLKKISIAVAALFLPALAFAQPTTGFGGIGTTVASTIAFINNFLVPFVFAAAFLLFIWGMFKFFIMGGHNEESRGEGRSLMLWGVVGFVMMVSIWGVVNVVASGLNFNKSRINDIPTVPGTRGSGGGSSAP